ITFAAFRRQRDTGVEVGEGVAGALRMIVVQSSIVMNPEIARLSRKGLVEWSRAMARLVAGQEKGGVSSFMGLGAASGSLLTDQDRFANYRRGGRSQQKHHQKGGEREGPRAAPPFPVTFDQAAIRHTLQGLVGQMAAQVRRQRRRAVVAPRG